jgi:O-succinylbenzoic acid--CoA ligase
MSPPGRPKGEYRSAQREGTPVSPPGRPKGEYRSASDPLSIFGAAQDAPAAPGLRLATRSLSFAELAAMTARRMAELGSEVREGTPYPLLGTNTLETVITLYGLLEMEIPALLVHPQLTATERAALSAAAARAGSVPHPGAAAIIHTSGTSGEPRGAVLTRSALLASAQASAANLGWEPDDTWMLCMPIARIGGLSILTRALAARRCVALAEEFNAAAFPEWIASHRVTLVSLVPTMLMRVLDRHPAWTAPTHLRAVLLGGAAASPRLLERAVARRCPLVLTYGLTETCSQVCATPYAARFAPADWGAGIALSGIDVRTCDERIEVRGPVLTAGYWNEAPLAPHAWFDTGDLGALDARGCLHVHARRADLIVTGGENAYPAEIEHALEAFPGIAAAGVFGMPDEVWGHTVAAALVAEQYPPSDAELIEYLYRRLAPHKRPRHVCYVDRLPLAPTGKLDRRALPGVAQGLRPLPRIRASRA